MAHTIQRWIRTSDGALPRILRSARRWLARRAAVRHHGSVTAALDATAQRARTLSDTSSRTVSARRPQRLRTVVAVSSYEVRPQHSGGQLRAGHLLTALARESDVEVVIVSARPDGPTGVTREHLHRGVTERSVRLSDEHSRAETELRLLTGNISITDIALSCLWPMSPDLVASLGEALAEADAVVYVQPYLAPAVAALAPGIPGVVDEHNHETALKSGILPPNDGGRWLLQHVAEAERCAVSASQLVTATTDADLASIRVDFDVARRAAAVVPNGVDTTAIRFVTGSERRAAGEELRARHHVTTSLTAIFVGSGHGPNIEAGRLILAMAPSAPEITFLLGGRHADALRGHRVPRNVRLLGSVTDDELTTLLSGANVALNPMATGGGSNLKLMTYMASGVPVVSTSLGARGVTAVEAGVIVAELDDQLDGIREALAGAPELARLGRRYVVGNCDWRNLGTRFAALVHEHVLDSP